MISQLKKQDIDLWEAWIEYDQLSSGYFGILYVIGEIMVDQSFAGPAVNIVTIINSGRQLVLEVPERPLGRCKVKEILYSEPIRDLSQYSCISIYAGDELLANFDEIEVFI